MKPKKKSEPPCKLEGPEGDLYDHVCRIRNAVCDHSDDCPELAEYLERLLDDDAPLPTAAQLKEAQARFFALDPILQSDIFNGWATMTPALPDRSIGFDTFQRVLCIDPETNRRTATVGVENRLRDSTHAVEVLIVEGTPFVEALAGIEIARDLILRQWARLISSSKEEKSKSSIRIC